MVSCTRIENSLQAYIDGELGASERVMVEEHVGECRVCARSLRTQQRANVLLYDAFAQDRLTRSLRSRIVAHLPEIEPVRRDSDSIVDLINERTKHPVSWWGQMGRLVPVAAVAILVFVGLVLRYGLPESTQKAPVTSIGFVSYASGVATHALQGAPEANPAEVSQYVMRGDTFETRPGSALMLTLMGPTALKVGDNTRLRVEDSRSVTLEHGQIWLDVARDGRLFKVHTPRGEVTVFGTIFSVSHIAGETKVTVEHGKVQVTQGDDFATVDAGQQTVAKSDGEVTAPALVNSKQEHAWARRIMPDAEIEALHNKRLQAMSRSGELPSRLVYKVDPIDGQAVTAIRLYWQPDQYLTEHCSYDLYVYGDAKEAILHRRVEGSQFADPGVSSLEIVPDKPIVGESSLEIRLVPDYRTGRIELEGVHVKAMVVGEGS